MEHLYTLQKFPLCQSGTLQPQELDTLGDIEIVGCKLCGCVQHKTLVDPIILYQDVHNLTYLSPTWATHHDLFSEFILHNMSSSRCMEIGGYSGVLAKKLLSKRPLQYSILDLCNTDPCIPGVHFFHGNCETFDFSGVSSLVLSHTFEHLYSPAKFLENIATKDVSEISISVPNLEAWIGAGAISALHIEHTFMFNESILKNLFLKYGYTCRQVEYYKSHSMFMYFTKNNCDTSLVSWGNPERMIKNMKSYLYHRDRMFESIQISTPCFLFPSGHFGQTTYYFLQRFKSLILGFLDNDTSKVGKRVYGTPYMTYLPKKLLDYKDTDLTIVISAGPYSKEIEEQVRSLHPNCIVQCVDLVIPCENE